MPQVPLELLEKLLEYFDEPSKEFQLDPSFEDTNTDDIAHKVVEPFAEKKMYQFLKIFKNWKV